MVAPAVRGEPGGHVGGEGGPGRRPVRRGGQVRPRGAGRGAAAQRVAGRAGRAGPGDAHREAGQGVVSDGDGEVAVDLDGRDPGLGFEAGGEGLACFGCQAERQAGGVAAGLRTGAEQRVVVVAGRGEDGAPQLGGDHWQAAGGQLADHADHLVRVEGLGQVGVGADPGAVGLVVLLGPGGDQHHLDVGRVRRPAQLHRRLPAVQPRHHHVQRDDVRVDFRHLVQAVLPVHRRLHLEPLELEVYRDQPPDHLVVVHDEHPSQSVRHSREGSVSRAVMAPANATCPRRLCDWYPLVSHSPHSSGERATASGAVSAGSNPAGGAPSVQRRTASGLRFRRNVRCHAWSRPATGCHCGTVPAPRRPPGAPPGHGWSWGRVWSMRVIQMPSRPWARPA